MRLLSHLAIIARERRVPVVVRWTAGAAGLKPGDKVKMDGGTGRVEKVLAS
jgi:phosphoenolpyruvate-protein kinase (PTS system EI component)